MSLISINNLTFGYEGSLKTYLKMLVSILIQSGNLD